MRVDRINPNFQVNHSINQTEYIMWKYTILENLCGYKPYTIKPGANSFSVNESIKFGTRGLPCLKPIYDIVIKQGKKHVNIEWLNSISHPVAFAAWFLDDGSTYTKRLKSGYPCTSNMSIALGNLPIDECELLKNWMMNRWGIESIIYPLSSNGRGKYSGRIYNELRIYKRKNFERVKELVEPYSVPSMKYKTVLQYKNLRDEVI